MHLLQTMVLTELGKKSASVVQLFFRASSFKNRHWHAMLVKPFGKLLATRDSVGTFRQAYFRPAFDTAAAIGGSFDKGIRHQDVSPLIIKTECS